MKRYSAIHVAKFLSPEDVVKRNRTKTILDVGHFAGERRSLKKGYPFTDSLVLDQRSKQTSIPVIGRGAQKNMLAVDVRNVMSESRFKKSAARNTARHSKAYL